MILILKQLPILQVLIPFISAPICVLIGNRKVAWLISLIATFLTVIISFLILINTSQIKIISYSMGGWKAPLGIEYVIDPLNSLFLVLISGVSFLVVIFSKEQLSSDLDPKHHTLFYTCLLLCITGLLGVLITGDVFNVFVFLEISSLATYVLVAQGYKKNKKALYSAFNYLIMGTVGATFFVIGIGFLYVQTGSLNMLDIYERIQGDELSKTIQVAYVFIAIGMGLKLAMFPLHMWLPNAYTFSPTLVSTFLSATATKVSMYILIRFTFSVFNFEFDFIESFFDYLVTPLAIIAMFLMSLIAIFQKNIKKMLAYSSISQIGYMLLGLSFLNKDGIQATLVTMFNHGITKATLFMGLGVFLLKVKIPNLDNLKGLGRKMPFTSLAFFIGCLSLVGIPGTAGFVSKWLLVETTLNSGNYVFGFLIVLSSLITFIYVWFVLDNLFLKESTLEFENNVVPLSTIFPLWTFAFFCIFFGIFTSLTLTTTDLASNLLFKN